MDELLNDLAIQNDDTEVKESLEDLLQKEQV